MEDISIVNWVNCNTDENEKELRQAVHTVLHSISASDSLQRNMLIKGGILLAIRYQNDRFTKDIDFSTVDHYASFNQQAFIEEFESSLANSVDDLDYNLDCRIQSHKIQPKEEGNFQTLKINIGYAYLGSPKHKRLSRKASTSVISIDYSFNEYQYHTENIHFIDCGIIRAYSLIDIVSEKYRAIIQQDPRERIRGQDIYDIYRLLCVEDLDLNNSEITQNIHVTLIEKCASREIHPDKSSLNDPKVIERSETGYAKIAPQVVGELPEFSLAYGVVQKYFESFPWSECK